MGNPLNHKARKRFGQNFLHDADIIARIISSIAATSQQHIVEIGPGKGALTEHLINSAGQLDVIELDRDLIPILEARFANDEHFKIHNIDALKFDFSTLIESDTRKLRLVGNLPYNISTPLIFHLLDNADIIEDMHFMLQKEVVERLTASPNTKAYGRLSILVQYLCHAEQLFIVPPGAFNPVPKVDSAIVQLTPRKQRPEEQQLYNAELNDLAFIAKAAFAQRRKTLRNNLKKILTAEQISQCAIDPARRAETLTISEFVALTNRYAQAPET
ncbi:MAG: 16S rRNA (adenine(1518)-N(6)/adenine(1519)-N(6))-dimethyltransferase RsmA [gamma proteobacterium symbiont of Bathyaustriella thionipta]|nr:16S rRNA (adenine(1518)-N(6)/adenine(1519)-N(6))-dimethyltransferase RsmA [gamma proteobacterium symbiont of Bathyaustriella thionipta]MCU7950546.1 16S rRNA (adenine(1518)-N(6)/adenine(1519)-N(6))-dimethyltransferase RsmA [gamma proteobacterium symbiont of Bathyaustriella thionipta]MCU7953021.1 16S rRNA (adenine(1518)-N(6)/adenine(1519)-N(6))-dimethyltransferase RsmA [gamma proteobacterium symbiont of Bathyaustriella thionipta]MCU7957054.1 16S rRNA (adenine(1518)-N(6)/adenine(1519)-N(6))-dime